MAITTRQAVQNYMLIDIDVTLHDQVDEWITGVEDEINRATDRRIVAADADEEFLFDGNNKNKLLIPDFVSITSVSIDGSDITTDCYFYPQARNKARPVPFTEIVSDTLFNSGRQNVSVIGKQGYCEQGNLPSDIKWAATVLVAGIINFSNNHDGEIVSETVGRYSVSYKNDNDKKDYERAKAIIKSYRRIR